MLGRYALRKGLKYLRRQLPDLVLFYAQAVELGALDLSNLDAGKLGAFALAGVEWIAKHGTPTVERVKPFLRERGLID